MIAKGNVKLDNICICMIDEYRSGEKEAFDGHVQRIQDDGIHVCYLSGYKSRNDFVLWEDVIAKVDKRKARVTLEDRSFSGQFEVFDKEVV